MFTTSCVTSTSRESGNGCHIGWRWRSILYIWAAVTQKLWIFSPNGHCNFRSASQNLHHIQNAAKKLNFIRNVRGPLIRSAYFWGIRFSSPGKIRRNVRRDVRSLPREISLLIFPANYGQVEGSCFFFAEYPRTLPTPSVNRHISAMSKANFLTKRNSRREREGEELRTRCRTERVNRSDVSKKLFSFSSFPF